MKEENPWIEICPGIKRRTHAHGRTMYQMIAELDVGSRMPEHQHSQEQLVHILSGRMKLIVEGVPHELKPACLLSMQFFQALTSRARVTTNCCARFWKTQHYAAQPKSSTVMATRHMSSATPF